MVFFVVKVEMDYNGSLNAYRQMNADVLEMVF